jgi:cobaltochelatase CobN
VILLLSNADTELLAVRTLLHRLPAGFPPVRAANPAGLDAAPDVDGAELVVVRLLGGRAAWEAPFDALRAACHEAGVPFVAVGGEAMPDPEMAAWSTVPTGIATEVHRYFAAGGPANLEHLLRFLADTVLLDGFGFDPPAPVPMVGVYEPRAPATEGIGSGPGTGTGAAAGRRPTVGVVFYRAHLLAGNTQFVDDLCAALDRAGVEPLAVYCYSLRPDADGRVPALELCREHGVDALVTTVLAMGSSGGNASAPDDPGDGAWEVPELAGLGVPVVQAPSCNRSRDQWLADAAGLSPLDVALGVAIPEFDGRIVGPAFAFKEQVDDGGGLGTPVIASRTDPDRTRRVAGMAARLAGLRHTPRSRRRVAVVLSAYPTKRSRLGNAVGLDTPASTIGLLHALRDAGYDVPGDGIPADGDALMALLGERLTYEHPTLTADQAALAVGRLPAEAYTSWFATLPADAREQVEAMWGPPPGQVYVTPRPVPAGREPRAPRPGASGAESGDTASPDRLAGSPARATVGSSSPLPAHDLVFPGLELGNVLVTIQPPRGFGTDPIGTYHAPDMPPPHHYLAFYRWLDEAWGADAIVHVGKHGTLEWLPGKANALSGACFPDAALGDVPFVYPFVVNDPGEGTQAKRRSHAVVVDHLVPPMTRAEAYDDLARLERLLDAYAQAQAMDPAKLPALRQQVWELLVEAEIHRDLGLAVQPGGDDEFDDVVLHVDGYLCALKDAQIRGGLHVLGVAPEGEALVDLVLGVTRLPQGGVPSLRAAVAAGLGVDLSAGDGAPGHRADVDRVEAECRARVAALAAAGWRVPPGDAAGAPHHAGGEPGPTPGGRTGDSGRDEHRGPNGRESPAGDAERTERWVCERLVPALRRTPDEIGNLLAALGGRYVPAGPSGAPTRGGAHVLPTGRNFYSVDPKALPSPLSWEVGRHLAEALVERHVTETGAPPRTVGLVLWGTAAMRTGGDDAAEALALLGVRPVWEDESGRVTGLEPIPLAELGRPRVDVTLRISGFFRDAFPHLVALLDDAVALVAGLDEPSEQNPVRSAGAGDARIWGPPPGGYGSGILPVLERGSWRTDADLAEVYLAWSGFAYGRDRSGEAAPEAMRRRFAAIEVAVKNQDNREHDIFDSDDYLQDHGGMVAAVRSLTGRAPRAWFGDTADPAAPAVRALGEEAARVVRSRVLNPKWITAMRRHGYKGAFELAATVDYLFGYDATAHVVEDWMYERVTAAYVADPELRAFFAESNPTALRSIAEKLLEADRRGMWQASEQARKTLVDAVLEAEGWEEAGS